MRRETPWAWCCACAAAAARDTHRLEFAALKAEAPQHVAMSLALDGRGLQVEPAALVVLHLQRRGTRTRCHCTNLDVLLAQTALNAVDLGQFGGAAHDLQGSGWWLPGGRVRDVYACEHTCAYWGGYEFFRTVQEHARAAKKVSIAEQQASSSYTRLAAAVQHVEARLLPRRRAARAAPMPTG